MEKSPSRTKEMQHLRYQEKWSLQQIATKFGVSRERVRQLIGNSGKGLVTERQNTIYNKFKHLTNKALGKLLGVQAGTVMRDYRNGERHEIEGGVLKVGVEAEILVSKKLSSLGIRNTLMPHHHPFDILLGNGTRIDVKSSRPQNNSKTISPLYNFSTKKQIKKDFCDFFILFLFGENQFFIVPFKDAKTLIRFCYPKTNKGRQSKWNQYHNRFDLLKG
jgi:transcriptional regulator with XRE-family HTH domain